MTEKDHLVVDGGCDTCSIGGNAWIIDYRTGRYVDVCGFDKSNEVTDVEIGGGITATDLPDGTTILLKVNEASILGEKGCSLLSISQMRHNQVNVSDIPKRFGGFPHIEVDGIIIPMSYVGGLLQISIRTPTQYEMNNCEVIELTSEEEWLPSLINDEEVSQDEYQSYCSDNSRMSLIGRTKVQQKDVTKVAPYLLNPGEEIVKKTLEATTQLGKISYRVPLRPHLRMRNPILSKKRLMEPWATDTWFAKATSYEGYNCCQLFVGQKSYHIYLYGMAKESYGPDALMEFFREVGVPTAIRRDNSKMQTSQVWNSIMRKYNCSDQFIEPYNPQQNPAERRIGVLKGYMKRTIQDTGCAPEAWYRLACHAADVINHTAYKSLNWRTPLEMSLGETPDISGLLFFKFWEKVYYYDPPEEKEKKGRWLGRAINYGDTMAFWILTSDTNELIVRGTVRSAENTTRPNLAIDTRGDGRFRGDRGGYYPKIS